MNRALAKENKDTNGIYLRFGINSGFNVTNISFAIKESGGLFGATHNGRFQQNSFENIPFVAISKNYQNIFLGLEINYGNYYNWIDDKVYTPGYRRIEYIQKIPYTFIETTTKSYLNLNFHIDYLQIMRKNTHAGFRFGQNFLFYDRTKVDKEILSSEDVNIPVNRSIQIFKEENSTHYAGVYFGFIVNKKIKDRWYYNFNANASYLVQTENKKVVDFIENTFLRTFQIQNGISYRL
jgi:hypothetical protein